MQENNLSSISKTNSYEKMGEFWESHDFTEYDDDTPDVEFNVTCTIAIEPELLASVESQAKRRGITVETLVNLWLQEKLLESKQLLAA